MLKLEKVYCKTIDKIQKLKLEMPQIAELIELLESSGNVIIFGGAIRDFVLDRQPRDYDFVIDTKNSISDYLRNYNYIKNSFDGYKVLLSEARLDIWALKDTWAFKKGIITQDISNLTKTVFFNADAVAVNITTGQVFESGFVEAFESKVLNIILAENPLPELCVLRAFAFNKNYSFEYSHELFEYITNWISRTEAPLQVLLKVQKTHYNRTLFTENDIMELINRFT